MKKEGDTVRENESKFHFETYFLHFSLITKDKAVVDHTFRKQGENIQKHFFPFIVLENRHFMIRKPIV